MMEFTFCGYDGNDMVVVYIRADSLDDARNKSRGEFSSGSADFEFRGHLDELSDAKTINNWEAE